MLIKGAPGVSDICIAFYVKRLICRHVSTTQYCMYIQSRSLTHQSLMAQHGEWNWDYLSKKSLAPLRYGNTFESIIFKHMVQNTGHSLWNCSPLNAATLHWWWVNIGSGIDLVPSTNVGRVLWRHMTSLDHNAFTFLHRASLKDGCGVTKYYF